MTGQSRSTMLLAVALIVQPVPALARGSFGNADPPWNREHLDRLPEEVQRTARRLCPNEPHAAHYFATYSENCICAMRRAACIRFTSCAADTISSFVVFMAAQRLNGQPAHFLSSAISPRHRRGRWICSSLNVRDSWIEFPWPYSRRIRWSTD